MTTSGNGTGNLLDEFEQCFMSIMQVLSREEENFDSLEKDEVHVDIEQATLKFVDIGRQLEAFFLQKRFLLSVLKPELIVKEEISELKNELARKDDLIKRHYEKIAVWQTILSDVQGRGKSPAQSTNQPLGFPVSSGTSGVGTPMPESGDNFMNLFQQQQMQHQHMQQTQQQQQLQQFQQQQMQQQQMQQQQAQIQQQQMQQQQAQIQQQQMASQMQQQQQIVSQMQQSQQIPTQMQQQQMPSQLQQQQQMQSQQIPSQMQQQQMSSPMQPQQMPSPMSQQQMPSPMQQQQMPPQMQQQSMPPQQIPGSMGPSSVSGGPGAMMTPQQAMFMQQQRMSQFSSNTSPSILAGPLAFLEKTTSNIGMSDGRR